MSVITKKSLVFSPSAFGGALIANQKPLKVNRVAVVDVSGFQSFVKAQSEQSSYKLAVSFDSSFRGDFKVRKIEFYQDKVLLGTVTTQVAGVDYDIYNIQQGYIYINGLVIDFLENKNILTVNYYKGNVVNDKPSQDDLDLSLIETLLRLVGTSQADELISDDKPNDLKLGSDNKLVSQPNDINFLAYYILSKG
ncbi:hypothetical protein ENHY17A_50384 [Moraxellaceae bacterium 17A]|nr:hypothetical protein ENHY17A_50384 [Moraxellaceae bacterium 17A]